MQNRAASRLWMTVHVPSRARASRRGAESARFLARDDTRRRTETDARDDAAFRMCIATNPSRRDEPRFPIPSTADHARLRVRRTIPARIIVAGGSARGVSVPSFERCRLGRVAVAVVVQGTERERRRMRLRRRRIRVRLRAGRGDFRGGVQRRKRRDGDWERRGLRGWIPERASPPRKFPRARVCDGVPRVRAGRVRGFDTFGADPSSRVVFFAATPPPTRGYDAGESRVYRRPRRRRPTRLRFRVEAKVRGCARVRAATNGVGVGVIVGVAGRRRGDERRDVEEGGGVDAERAFEGGVDGSRSRASRARVFAGRIVFAGALASGTFLREGREGEEGIEIFDAGSASAMGSAEASSSRAQMPARSTSVSSKSCARRASSTRGASASASSAPRNARSAGSASGAHASAPDMRSAATEVGRDVASVSGIANDAFGVCRRATRSGGVADGRFSFLASLASFPGLTCAGQSAFAISASGADGRSPRLGRIDHARCRPTGVSSPVPTESGREKILPPYARASGRGGGGGARGPRGATTRASSPAPGFPPRARVRAVGRAPREGPARGGIDGRLIGAGFGASGRRDGPPCRTPRRTRASTPTSARALRPRTTSRQARLSRCASRRVPSPPSASRPPVSRIRLAPSASLLARRLDPRSSPPSPSPPDPRRAPRRRRDPRLGRGEGEGEVPRASRRGARQRRARRAPDPTIPDAETRGAPANAADPACVSETQTYRPLTREEEAEIDALVDEAREAENEADLAEAREQKHNAEVYELSRAATSGEDRSKPR